MSEARIPDELLGLPPNMPPPPLVRRGAGQAALDLLRIGTDRDENNWRLYAACMDTDPDLFFPVGETGPAVEQIEAAKAICTECESRQPCLEFAITTDQQSGVWGGTSEEERRKLRSQWMSSKRR